MSAFQIMLQKENKLVFIEEILNVGRVGIDKCKYLPTLV